MDKKEYIQSKIRDIKDFPKEGIIFKDITPLLMDVKGVEYVIDLLVENLKGQKVDKRLGGDIVQLDFLMELHFLNGREKLKGLSVYSIL